MNLIKGQLYRVAYFDFYDSKKEYFSSKAFVYYLLEKETMADFYYGEPQKLSSNNILLYLGTCNLQGADEPLNIFLMESNIIKIVNNNELRYVPLLDKMQIF